VRFSTPGGIGQTRFVDGGSGRGGQEDQVLVCGLGNDAGPVTCEIRWASNRVQTYLPEALNTVLTVTEEVDPGLRVSTQRFRYEIKPGDLVDWIFSGETDAVSDGPLDRVMIDPNVPYWCEIPYYELTTETPGVTLTMTPLAHGGYLHELRLSDGPCNTCTYQYRVHSERDGTVTESPEYRTFKFKLCPSGQ
jgi:hypothetical protein